MLSPLQKAAVIDIETLDTTTDAVVLSIGVALVPDSPEDEVASTQWKLQIVEQVERGRTISPDTLTWQRENDKSGLTFGAMEDFLLNLASDGAHASALTEPWTALRELVIWLKEHEVKEFWGQGYGFDFNIIQSLFSSTYAAWCPTRGNRAALLLSQADWDNAVPFYAQRDSRTLFKLFEEDPRKLFTGITAHDAEADAVAQAEAIRWAYDQLSTNLTTA